MSKDIKELNTSYPDKQEISPTEVKVRPLYESGFLPRNISNKRQLAINLGLEAGEELMKPKVRNEASGILDIMSSNAEKTFTDVRKAAKETANQKIAGIMTTLEDNPAPLEQLKFAATRVFGSVIQNEPDTGNLKDLEFLRTFCRELGFEEIEDYTTKVMGEFPVTERLKIWSEELREKVTTSVQKTKEDFKKWWDSPQGQYTTKFIAGNLIGGFAASLLHQIDPSLARSSNIFLLGTKAIQEGIRLVVSEQKEKYPKAAKWISEIANNNAIDQISHNPIALGVMNGMVLLSAVEQNVGYDLSIIPTDIDLTPAFDLGPGISVPEPDLNSAALNSSDDLLTPTPEHITTQAFVDETLNAQHDNIPTPTHEIIPSFAIENEWNDTQPTSTLVIGEVAATQSPEPEAKTALTPTTASLPRNVAAFEIDSDPQPRHETENHAFAFRVEERLIEAAQTSEPVYEVEDGIIDNHHSQIAETRTDGMDHQITTDPSVEYIAEPSDNEMQTNALTTDPDRSLIESTAIESNQVLSQTDTLAEKASPDAAQTEIKTTETENTVYKANSIIAGHRLEANETITGVIDGYGLDAYGEAMRDFFFFNDSYLTDLDFRTFEQAEAYNKVIEFFENNPGATWRDVLNAAARGEEWAIELSKYFTKSLEDIHKDVYNPKMPRLLIPRYNP